VRRDFPRVAKAVWALPILGRAGLLRPVRPDRLARMALALHRYGVSLAGAYAIQAARQPDRVALIDHLGSITFAQIEGVTTEMACGLADLGIGPSDRVAVLARNHRGFVESTVALAKLGADTLYLNTGFAGPQMVEVLEREGATAIILDGEFASLAELLAAKWLRVFSSAADPARSPTLDELAAAGSGRALPPPSRRARQIVLTSGTTGTPKGTLRDAPSNLDPLLTIVSMIPLRSMDVTLIAAPMFHTWGLAHLALAMALGSTLLLRPRFDPSDALALVEERRVTVLAAVPVMLQRLVDAAAAAERPYDTSSLRIVATSGSALPGDLALRFMNRFGDVLYNLYGSTEVAWASIATPEDLRAAPGTAGRPPPGTVVRLVDDEDRPVGPSSRGRIFVGNSMLFSGYTDKATKPILGGLMATGDTGYLDSAGRLFVEGRDDDMIVSGGENVFPREVEDLLANHPAVLECVVVGVADERFGQRLKAFVVLRSGHDVSAEDLRTYVRDRLARYKVPREVVFLDALPRNATGKIVKRHLPPSAL
jgi:acyl-CoA synthetase (AMP-forming)/AMP-acid ligase II